MSAKIPSDINETAIKTLRTRRDLHAMIVRGMLPATRALLDGAPFMSNSIETDMIAWAHSKLLTVGIENHLLPTLTNLSNNPTLEAVQILLYADEGRGDLGADVDRLMVYRSCLGDVSAMSALKDMLLGYVCSADVHSFSNFIRRCVGEGLKINQKSMLEAFQIGLKRMTDFAEVGLKFSTALEWFIDGEPERESEGEVEKPAMPPSAIEDDAAFLRAVEDRSETFKAPAGAMIVVPKFTVGATGHRKDLQKGWLGYDGAKLPLVARGDLAAHRTSLVGRWPYAEEIIDVLLGDLATSEAVRFRPTLLVGQPGCGKTSLARQIAETIGLPVTVVNLGGAADSSLAGTSAQWHSAREAVPLQLIKTDKIANPLIVWDEVEKASADRRNGSAFDAILPMLERSQATRFRDPALEVDCDLSMVSHFATANSLDGVPAPLRDRMRILQMHEPTWQHLPSLVEDIVWDLMTERGLDVRWIQPLAEDELDLVRQAWPGGSIRQLQRIVQTLVDGREAVWGNA